MEELLNKKHNIHITVLSPLSIGAGAEKDLVKGVDFVIKDSKVYVLNLKKVMLNGFNPEEMSGYFANKNLDAVLQKIGNKLNDVSEAVFDLPVNDTNDIKSFLKNQLSGKPIIAGSSLKGAVRSIILEYLLNGEKLQQGKEKEWFGDSNRGNELMRFIKFSDAEFDKTQLVNTKIFNLHSSGTDWKGGWKYSGNNTNTDYQATGFNTIYECLMPNETAVCSIMINEKGFDFNDRKNDLQSNQNYINHTNHSSDNLQSLFSVINGHTKKYIDKEITFFTKYSTQKADEIIKSLEAIKEQIPQSDEYCILKMSAGSGFHSITGDWQYDDYSDVGVWNIHPRNGREDKKNGKHKYKSRKIAISGKIFSLMGFVKLSLISDEEMQKCQNERKKQREDAEKVKIAELVAIREEQEQKAKEEVEWKRKLEEERLQKEEAEKAEQARWAAMTPDDREKEKYQKTSDYGNLINTSLQNTELTSDFFKWLRQLLIDKKQWKTDGNPAKDKSVKRSQAVEAKISQ